MEKKRKRQSYRRPILIGLVILCLAAFLLLLRFANPPLYINPTAEYLQNHPMPTPEYLVGHSNYPLWDCLHFTMEAFWTSGFDNGELLDSVVDTAVLYVDSAIVPKETIAFIDGVTYYPVIEDNEIVGTYTGPLDICLDLSPYENGLHHGRIEFSTNGQFYAYEWVILVDRNREDPSNQLAPTIVLIYTQTPEP